MFRIKIVTSEMRSQRSIHTPKKFSHDQVGFGELSTLGRLLEISCSAGN